jgi:putative transposase
LYPADAGSSFWEQLIRDDEDFRRHIEYCYINPVTHGLVHQRSRLAAFVVPPRRAGGTISKDWASDVSAQGDFGER